MIRRTFILFLLILNAWGIKSQNEEHRIFATGGYTFIPLQIKRTDVTRWMVFPAIDAGYQLNSGSSILLSYLHFDIRAGNFSSEESYLYSETPRLQSYDQALMFVGNKVDPSEFSHYFFAGIQHRTFGKKGLELLSVAQLGIRTGYTFIVANIFKEPQSPNGFKGHFTIQDSSSPGLRLAFNSKVNLTNFAFLGTSIGAYIFTNWPVVQLFGGIHLGVSI